MPKIKSLKSPYAPATRKPGKWSNVRDKFLDSAAWRQTRKQYIYSRILAGSDSCDVCGYVFRDVSITRHGQQYSMLDVQVDHIQPRSQGGEALEHSNLQLLCSTCHARKTRKEIQGNR